MPIEQGEPLDHGRNLGGKACATAHAGEHRPAEMVIESIKALGLGRVGHGVRAVDSPDVMRQLAKARRPLEVCLDGDLALRLYPSVAEHPVRRLADAGCTIVLGTDDQGFFGTDLSTEYALAIEADSRLRVEKVSADAIAAAFCDEQTRAVLDCMLEKRPRTYR